MLLAVAAAVLIALSVSFNTVGNNNNNDEERLELWYTTLSLTCLISALVFHSARTALIKYFLDIKSNQGNVSAFYNFTFMFLDLILLV